MINDNNKAQRNMSVHYGLSGFGSTHYAIIRNASKKQGDFVLKLTANQAALKGIANPTVRAQGAGDAIPFMPGAHNHCRRYEGRRVPLGRVRP